MGLLDGVKIRVRLATCQTITNSFISENRFGTKIYLVNFLFPRLEHNHGVKKIASIFLRTIPESSQQKKSNKIIKKLKESGLD